MLTYLGRRFLAVIPVLFGVTLAVFSMLFLVPGDPVKMMLAEFVTTPDQIEQMRAQLHLDEPILKQYGRFVGNALRGDLGTSIRSRRAVSTEIGENVGSTAQLALASMAVAVAIGVPLGLMAALLRNSWFDAGSMIVALLGVSMPSFWLGLLMIVAFSLHLGWFPATGGGDLWHLVLPSVTLGMIASAIIARLTRSSMLEVLGQDYVRTARAKGLAWWGVVVRHALKNALIPVITIFGLQFGNLLAGAVIVETVFSRPGLGRLIVGGILAKDFPLVQGTVLFVATAYVMINVLVDIAYAFVDPRIRFG
ncbi:MAG: peptide ABC transporter permease [Candidatus Rokuibacteriota bacterium]|nr:MAG: peptide ABC transporter permease [Candidatus Rokubacteria bacterium]PYO12070.1 MAG: peptide ABC transporter permease [Candidatus Rokubacteria bacterium]